LAREFAGLRRLVDPSGGDLVRDYPDLFEERQPARAGGGEDERGPAYL